MLSSIAQQHLNGSMFELFISHNFQKRLESLTEAELQALLEQVEEEKQRLPKGEQV